MCDVAGLKILSGYPGSSYHSRPLHIQKSVHHLVVAIATALFQRTGSLCWLTGNSRLAFLLCQGRNHHFKLVGHNIYQEIRSGGHEQRAFLQPRVYLLTSYIMMPHQVDAL